MTKIIQILELLKSNRTPVSNVQTPIEFQSRTLSHQSSSKTAREQPQCTGNLEEYKSATRIAFDAFLLKTFQRIVLIEQKLEKQKFEKQKRRTKGGSNFQHNSCTIRLINELIQILSKLFKRHTKIGTRFRLDFLTRYCFGLESFWWDSGPERRSMKGSHATSG